MRAIPLLAAASLLLGFSSVAARTPTAALPSVSAPRPAATQPPEAAETRDCAQADGPSAALELLPISSAPFRPFFKSGAAPTTVKAFRLARAPVTRQDFLSFLKCHPEWRRSHASAGLSEAAYLSDFESDLAPGPAPLEAPITFVSWFAARAFCASKGLRLPSTVEWERALGGYGDRSDAVDSTAAASFAFAMGRPAVDLSLSRLEARAVWEWTSDFNSAPEAGAASQFCGDGVRSNAPNDYAAFLRYSFRSSLKAGYALKNLGFRCARDEAP
ncbi:MAG TPA: formylglycine-generating enzyme family protein [Polyangiaceae bacterium]|nr:formylglycine-generating enzyme family protein [Polyangiaceae bacterium]